MTFNCFQKEKSPIDLLGTETTSELTLKHQIQYMQEQIQQMQHQSELNLDEMKLIREQLKIEVDARIEAQV